MTLSVEDPPSVLCLLTFAHQGQVADTDFDLQFIQLLAM